MATSAAGSTGSTSRSGWTQTRWRAVNAPHLVALVRAGAVFKNGKLIELMATRTEESFHLSTAARPRREGRGTGSGTAGGLAVLFYAASPQFYCLEAQGLTHADMGI